MRGVLAILMAGALAATARAEVVVVGNSTNNLGVFDAFGALVQLVPIPTTFGSVSQPNCITSSATGDIYIGQQDGTIHHLDAGFVALGRYAAGYSPFYGLITDPSGTIYCAGSGLQAVRRLTATGSLIGDWSAGSANIRNFAWDPMGNLLVSDFNWGPGGEINVHSPAGTIITTRDAPGLDAPFGMAAAPGGGFWVADQNSIGCFRFDAAGAFVSSFVPAGFSGSIWNIESDANGWLYLPERYNTRVHVYDANQVFVRFLTAPGLSNLSDALVTGMTGAGARIALIETTPTQVAPGSSGTLVMMTIENLSTTDALDITAIGLEFTGTADRTSEYTVTPAPGNPTSIAAASSEVFTLQVDVAAMATEESITIDGTCAGNFPATMTPVSVTYAVTTDDWTVVGARPLARTVTAIPATVAQGSSGNRVDVAIENVGLTPWLVGATVLSFTGTADRSSEYTVTPAMGNPTVIAPGAQETLGFDVAVALGATLEAVTIDVLQAVGIDTITARPQNDAGADVTDSWGVVACAAMTCGDCDLNLQLTILDALKAAQIAAALIPYPTLSLQEMAQCDVDDDSDVDILDALRMAQAAAGLPVALVCC